MDPLSLILSLVLPLVPEPHRTYVHAAIVAWLYVTTVASIATAKLPAWAFKRWRVLRVLSWLSVLAPRDGAGTVKLPFTTPQAPGVLADLARFRAGAERIADAAAPLIPGAPPSDGQRGAVRVGALLVISGAVILATVVGAVAVGCREAANCDRRVDSWRCSPAGRPERCAEGNVWRSHYYGPCSLSRQRCVVLVGAATCLPIVDAATSSLTTDASASNAE